MSDVLSAGRRFGELLEATAVQVTSLADLQRWARWPCALPGEQ
jgi:hypothetical protein